MEFARSSLAAFARIYEIPYRLFLHRLSQQAHLGGWGLVKRAGFLLDEIRSAPETEALLKRKRYAYVGQTTAPRSLTGL